MKTYDYTVMAYCIYIPAIIALTIWVARTIHKNTKSFLLEIFPNHESVAIAVNNLLQMGFYLIALGYGYKRLTIKYSGSWFSSLDKNSDEALKFMTTQKELVEELASKLGGFTLFVGTLLFFNLFLMLMLRRSGRNNRIKEQQMQQYVANMNRAKS